MQILSVDEIERYRQIELAAEEYQKPEAEQRPWVLGNIAYRDRICAVVRWCLRRCDGDVLEIGAYGGSTTRAMADIARRFGRVVITVDPFDPDGPRGDHIAKVYKDFLRCSQEYLDSGLIRLIRGYSQSDEVVAEIGTRRYAFSFVDGSHVYEDALPDVLMAMRLTNGLICCHDWFYRGVKQAVAEALVARRDWQIVLEREEFAEIYIGRKHG